MFYQVVGEKSLHVVVTIFKSVIGFIIITPTKLVNGALVVPNGLALPSQAMEVDVVINASKLTRITTIVVTLALGSRPRQGLARL